MSIEPLDPKYVDLIYDELARLDVQLDADPLAYGPKRLNGKIAQARTMCSIAERVFLDASQKYSAYKRHHRKSELMLEMERKELLANDPEVRAGRAVSERIALADGKLREEVDNVNEIALTVSDLESVLAVIKAKRSDLRDIMGRLRDQMRLCQEEIGLGGRWGSRRGEHETGQGTATSRDMERVQGLIQEVRQATTYGKQAEEGKGGTRAEGVQKKDVLPAMAEAAEISDFLDNLDLTEEEGDVRDLVQNRDSVVDDLDLEELLSEL